MATGVFQHPGRAVQLGVPKEKCQKDRRNGLPFLSGSGYPVGGGVQAADAGRGTIIPGEAVSQGAVLGVWGVNGVGIAVSPPTDSEREGR